MTDNNVENLKFGGRNVIDITGMKFNRLTALYPTYVKKKLYWVCKCDCGNEISTFYTQLRRNVTKSCGCLNIEKIKERNARSRVMHGDVSGQYINQVKYNAKIRNIEYNVSTEYLVQLYIIQNKKCILSGLDLCFGRKYMKELQTASLDRIDSSKGYIEGNLQWTHKDVNRMKFEKTDNDFVKLCKLIVETSHERCCRE